MTIAVEEGMLAALEGFSGTIVRPGDADYDDVRRVYNGMIDRKPALIARCRGAADVVAALAAARANGFEISVRGGGHGVAGHCVRDGAVMIDLSEMRGIHVDPVGAHCPGRARGDVGRAEPRDSTARPGGHGRHGLDHGHLRPHAGRRPGVADAKVTDWPATT